MKRYMFLHFGFEPPGPEEMAKWKAWFASIADSQLDQGGFGDGREISREGPRDLPFGRDSITGYNIIEAENLAAAEALAQSNPFVDSIRIYELR